MSWFFLIGSNCTDSIMYKVKCKRRKRQDKASKSKLPFRNGETKLKQSSHSFICKQIQKRANSIYTKKLLLVVLLIIF